VLFCQVLPHRIWQYTDINFWQQKINFKQHGMLLSGMSYDLVGMDVYLLSIYCLCVCERRSLARHSNYRYWWGCFPSHGNVKMCGDYLCKCVLFSVPNHTTWAGNKDTVAHGVAFGHVRSQ
jgi:hypothetical protein